MKLETHYRNLRESLQVIEECIEKGPLQRQRNIGFNVSAACADLFEIFLHSKDLIDPGFVVKHEWFKSKRKVQEKFAFDFPSKDEILDILFQIEERRNVLCYGKPQKEEEILQLLRNFHKIQKIFRGFGIDV